MNSPSAFPASTSILPLDFYRVSFEAGRKRLINDLSCILDRKPVV